MNKKKKDYVQVLRSLTKKKVNINTDFIDVSKAEDLGNKSWGNIDYLCKALNAKVVGIHEYRKNVTKKYGVNDDIDLKKKSVDIPKGVLEMRESKTYHSYLIFAGDSNKHTSEHIRFREAISFVNGYNNKFINMKTKEDRKELKEVKKTKPVFNNDIVFQSDNEIPLKQKR